MVVPIAGGVASAAGAGNGLALVAGLLFFRIVLLTVRFRWIYVLPLDGMMLLLGNLFGSSLWLVLFRVLGGGFFCSPSGLLVSALGDCSLFWRLDPVLGISLVRLLGSLYGRLAFCLVALWSIEVFFFGNGIVCGWVGWNIGFVNALCACLFK